MGRANSARGNNFEDIPVARRDAFARRIDKKALKPIVIIAILIVISISFLISFILPTGFKSNYIDQLSTQISSDGRLLGHYPYKQALEDDLVTIYPGLRIHRDTYGALRSMTAEASRDGIQLVLLSGFRSIKLQKDIFYRNKSIRNQNAIERAKVSAPPGYSEHSTGYAIDLGDATRKDTDLETSFEETNAFRWLEQNAAKYHFVLSFPKGNPQKVSYEPWHWRYEGTVEALREFEDANEMLRNFKLPTI